MQIRNRKIEPDPVPVRLKGQSLRGNLLAGRASPANPGSRTPRRGFTLIELLVVIMIIVLLVSLGVPAIGRVRQQAKKLECSNKLRNLTLALMMQVDQEDRYPAAGYFGRKGGQRGWVVDLLPFIDQSSLYYNWDIEKSLTHPHNLLVSETHIPLLVCPVDLSRTDKGDLSYVLNGGVGFTVQWRDGTHDCPIAPTGGRLDLNGNGVVCPPEKDADGGPSDKDYFLAMGMTFNETWKWDVTVRHHTMASVVDGLTHTILISENVRAGADPENTLHSWGTNNPYLTNFYIGDPCNGGPCVEGNVDYRLANAGTAAINSGIANPEGSSPRPNSFHGGGVNMGFCDGRVQFVSEKIDGAIYAALASPAGEKLSDSPLRQMIISGGEY